MYWAGWWCIVFDLGMYTSLRGVSMKIAVTFILPSVCLSVLALLTV